MPLPAALQPLLSSPRFWTDFLWETDATRSGQTGGPYPQLDGCLVELPIATGFGLSLSLNAYLSYFQLDLTTPDRLPIMLAFDDQAHWHPHVLRWSELDTICRAVAVNDPELPHPGWVVLLLHRFAPICEGDDIESIVATLEAAWKNVGAFSESEIATFIEKIDARDAGFQWREAEPCGWCLEQEDREEYSRGLYTLRRPDNEKFPFAQWRQMIDAAERELSEAPIAAGAAASRQRPSPGCLPREKLHLYLSIPLNDPNRPIPQAFCKLFSDTLDRVLRDFQRGRCDIGGGTSMPNPDGTYTEIETRYFLKVKGDWPENYRLLLDLLWWSKAPASVKLSQSYTKPIPLELSKPPKEVGSIVLHLAELKTVRWRSGYRFDRALLTDLQRQTLLETLDHHQATGPNRDGWYRLQLADGGELTLCALRLLEDDELDGVTLCIHKLTAEVSAFIHQLISNNQWMLLPLVIAPTAKVAGQVDAPWPPVRVIQSPEELQRILAAGAFAWWSEPA
jgi:hypothetical protein